MNPPPIRSLLEVLRSPGRGAQRYTALLGVLRPILQLYVYTEEGWHVLGLPLGYLRVPVSRGRTHTYIPSYGSTVASTPTAEPKTARAPGRLFLGADARVGPYSPRFGYEAGEGMYEALSGAELVQLMAKLEGWLGEELRLCVASRGAFVELALGDVTLWAHKMLVTVHSSGFARRRRRGRPRRLQVEQALANLRGELLRCLEGAPALSAEGLAERAAARPRILWVLERAQKYCPQPPACALRLIATLWPDAFTLSKDGLLLKQCDTTTDDDQRI